MVLIKINNFLSSSLAWPLEAFSVKSYICRHDLTKRQFEVASAKLGVGSWNDNCTGCKLNTRNVDFQAKKAGQIAH